MISCESCDLVYGWHGKLRIDLPWEVKFNSSLQLCHFEKDTSRKTWVCFFVNGVNAQNASFLLWHEQNIPRASSLNSDILSIKDLYLVI